MADGKETQAGHRKGKGQKKRNWKNKEIEFSLLCMTVCQWNVAHEDCINRTIYGITRGFTKPNGQNL